jgi:hypothetical protein
MTTESLLQILAALAGAVAVVVNIVAIRAKAVAKLDTSQEQLTAGFRLFLKIIELIFGITVMVACLLLLGWGISQFAGRSTIEWSGWLAEHEWIAYVIGGAGAIMYFIERQNRRRLVDALNTKISMLEKRDSRRARTEDDNAQ